MLEVLSVNGSGRVRRRRFFLWLAPVVLASIAVPAGRADAEETKVSPTTVVEGLKTISHAAEEVAEYAGQDKAKAEMHASQVQPVWALIEGTIRANDQDAYDAFEDAIAGLTAAAKDGDGKKAESASKALGDAAKAYTAKFPAVSPAAASAPAPGERTAAAAPSPDAPAPAAAAETAQAGDANLARTGSMSDALAALAGLALALGGLAVIGGARRPSPIG